MITSRFFHDPIYRRRNLKVLRLINRILLRAFHIFCLPLGQSCSRIPGVLFKVQSTPIQVPLPVRTPCATSVGGKSSLSAHGGNSTDPHASYLLSGPRHSARKAFSRRESSTIFLRESCVDLAVRGKEETQARLHDPSKYGA